MFELQAHKNILCVTDKEPITSGSVNVYYTHFQFSEDWDGLARYAVFRGNGVSRTLSLDNDGVCSIPWECLVTPGVPLLCGVYGKDGDRVVLPTIWCSLGMILRGVIEGDPPGPPSPDIWLEALEKKQDKLTGKPGQVVGFNEQGDAVAQDSDGLTQSEADKRYLQLTGGVMTGNLDIEGQAPMLNVYSKKGSPSIYMLEDREEDGLTVSETELSPGGLIIFRELPGEEVMFGLYPVSRKSGKESVLDIVFADEFTGNPALLSNIHQPLRDTDAANKKYVDDAIKASVGDIAAALDAINGEVI